MEGGGVGGSLVTHVKQIVSEDQQTLPEAEDWNKVPGTCILFPLATAKSVFVVE